MALDSLLEHFIEGSRDNLSYIEHNLELIGNGDSEALNGVFRAAHTIKGDAGIVSFESIQTLMHKAEDLLELLRSGKIDFQPEITSILFEAFDEVTNLIDATEQEGEIVEANQTIISEIEQKLSKQIELSKNSKNQKSPKVQNTISEFKPPFNLIDDKKIISKIINSRLDFLSKYDISSVHFDFDEIKITEENLNHKRLYAVLFDLPEDCMLYGNDPIYVLSLLENNLLGIKTCILKNQAYEILNGDSDPEGLKLKTEIIAFIFDSYTNIKNTAFNFLDDLLFLPLDIASLLKIKYNEQNEIAFLESFTEKIILLIKENKISEIIENIDSVLPLIAKDSIQFSILQRIKILIKFVKKSDFPKLIKIIEKIPSGKIFDENKKIVQTTQEQKESKTTEKIEKIEENTSSESSELNNLDKQALEEIIDQQISYLNMLPENSSLESVTALLQQLKIYFSIDIPESFESIQQIKIFLKSAKKNIKFTSDEKAKEDEIEKQLKAMGLAESESKPEPNLTQKEESKKDTSSKNDDLDLDFDDDMLLDDDVLISDDGIVEHHHQQTQTQSTPKKTPEHNQKEVSKNQNILTSKMVKIEQETIDLLMNLVGELLVAKNSLPYLADSIDRMNKEEVRRGVLEKYTVINRLSAQLQDITMSMRMLPISHTFDKFPKLVRDYVKDLEKEHSDDISQSKKVKLEIIGEETKLDKNMIEMLSEPLIHIMRNSLDHGIESRKERLQKGKTEEGLIFLKATPSSDKIIIEVKDDGQGIDGDRVVHKVMEKELMPLDEIEKMSYKEKINLIFLPGISTAEKISKMSGRGVGMDSVRNAIQSLGGTIEIESILNQGTTIKLSIPASLAVSALLHISMNGNHYGFPMDSVNETVKIEENEITYLHNEPFIYIRGEVIPLLIIKEMLDMEKLKNKPLSIVVLNIKGNLISVVVNELLGQLDVVQKPLEGILENHPLLSGTALLGNGQIIMTINPVGLISLSHLIKTNVLI